VIRKNKKGDRYAKKPSAGKLPWLPAGVRGSVIIVVLILIPMITATGLAVHYMANRQADITMATVADQRARYGAEGATEDFIAYLRADTSGTRLKQLLDTPEGNYLANHSPTSPAVLPTKTDAIYPMRVLYTVKRVPSTNTNPYANSIAVEVEARVFNRTGGMLRWNGDFDANSTIYQELDLGGGRIYGCAANYDIWAGGSLTQSSLINFKFFTQGASYARDYYQLCGTDFDILGTACVDVWWGGNSTHSLLGDETVAVHRSIENCSTDNFGFNFCSGLGALAGFFRKIDCNAMGLTFGSAIGNDGDDGLPNSGDEINWINVCGDTAHCGYPVPYSSTDLPYEESYEYWMEKIVKNCPGDPAGCDWTGSIGKLHFLDLDNNNIPDAPFFFYDGDLNMELPFTMSMFSYHEHVQGKGRPPVCKG